MFQCDVSVQLQLSATDVAPITSGGSPELLCGLRQLQQLFLTLSSFFLRQNFNEQVQLNNIDV